MPAKYAIKGILFIFGCISVILGVIGAVVPILPTTPFLILAAYLFSKSSPKVHSLLTGLPYFGSAIIDWESNKVIRPKAKAMAILVVVTVIGSSIIFTKIHYGLKVMLVLIAVGCSCFILTRKSAP